MERSLLCVSAHGALVLLYKFYSVIVAWEKCGMPASSPRQSHPLCLNSSAIGGGGVRSNVSCGRESMYLLVTLCVCVFLWSE